MLTFKGNCIYDKAAIGNAVVVMEKNNVMKKTSDSKKELLRFFAAKEKAEKELELLEASTYERIGEENAAIFEIHRMLIEDEDYNAEVTEIIENRSVNAEYAVYEAGEKFARIFEAVEDDYISRRAEDMREISGRIIECLGGDEIKNKNVLCNAVICAKELTCADVAALCESGALAVVVERGSVNSHAAILLEGFGISSVVGVGEGFVSSVKAGDTVAIDKDTVYINPDNNTLFDIEKKLLQNKYNEAVIPDGVLKKGTRTVEVYTNISRIAEAEMAKQYGLGFGLVRSELLFDGRDDLYDEQLQTDVYKRIIGAANGERVIIRTFDFSDDKAVGAGVMGITPSGKRGIRLCLENKEMLRIQLRAILRASEGADVGVMFPMVSMKKELEEAIECFNEAKAELENEGVVYAYNIKVGIMIETPAAAVMADTFAPLVDFFSVGTNDLTQYTLAYDRADGGINPEYEAVLRLVEMAVAAAKSQGVQIGICGELACNFEVTKRLVDMGMDYFSVPLPYLDKVIKRIKECLGI